MKRAQGISINVIVIAAVALLVLVVLAAVFLGRFGGFSAESSSCKSQGGTCQGACPTGTTEFSAASCEPTAGGSSQRCCLAIQG